VVVHVGIQKICGYDCAVLSGRHNQAYGCLVGGRKLYEIDRILDVRPAASLKAGGAGIRYTCRIQGHETYIWLEDNRWFVEAKGKPRSQEVS
jgi:hypothetical protein